jgi:hypothetical protein
MKIFISLLIILFFTTSISAQVDTTNFFRELENDLENATTDNENSQLYDIIEYLIENPININSASIDDLLKIPFLNRQSASLIIQKRDLVGRFSSMDTLRALTNISDETIEKISPFIILKEEKEQTFFDVLSERLSDIQLLIRTRTITDIQEEAAYKTGKYIGPAYKIYNRLILKKNNQLRIGILTKKDAGEASLTDFTTFHLNIRELGPIKNFILGDYLFEFGQGLALTSLYSVSKGYETVQILPRNSRGLVPYLSSTETLFFRGAAAQISFNDVNIYTFYSNIRFDGSIDPVSNQITSIITSPYHRDSTELKHKNLIHEKMIGLSVNYSFGKYGEVGLLYFSTLYDNDFEHQSILDPSGNRFNYFSTSYNLAISKLVFSGETSFGRYSIATINSAQINIDKNFSLLFSYRDYPYDYWNLHANGFGEKSNTQNESGFYTGLHLRTDIGILDFYYDQFQFQFASKDYLFPSHGNEFLVYYTLIPLRRIELRLKYKMQTKDFIGLYQNYNSLIKCRTENYRAELQYFPTKNIRLKSRIEVVTVTPSTSASFEKGFLMFQDVNYTPIKSLSISARLVFFKTDSYNSRLYEFENDLTGVMTNPPLYDEGMRWYLLARYSTPVGLTLSLKYSELYKPGKNTLSSGDSLIQGNVDNVFSFQLDFQL